MGERPEVFFCLTRGDLANYCGKVRCPLRKRPSQDFHLPPPFLSFILVPSQRENP